MPQIYLYLALAPFALLLILIILVFMGINRKDKRFASLSMYTVSVLALVTLSTLELKAPDEKWLLVASHLSYALIAAMPVGWFLFCAEYALGRHDWLRPRLMAILYLIPLATAVLVWFDADTHLIWTANTITRDGSCLINQVQGYGPWFWVHFVYSYALYLGGAALIFRDFFTQAPGKRKQSILVILGVSIPLGFNLLYVLHLIPGLVRDFSPLALALSCPLFMASIYRYKLYGTRPLEGRGVFGQIETAMVLLDKDGMVLDLNKTAGKLLGLDSLQHLQIENLVPGLWNQISDLKEQALCTLTGKAARTARPLDIKIQVLHLDGQRQKGFFLGLEEPSRLSSAPSPSNSSLLSRREHDIYALLLKGYSNKQICSELNISENTAKTHIRHILQKTGSKNRHSLQNLLN